MSSRPDPALTGAVPTPSGPAPAGLRPPAAGAGAGGRPVPLRRFVRLKLRMLGNGLSGSTGRVVSFVAGVVLALTGAWTGFLLFALSAAGGGEVQLLVAALGGAALVLGAVLLPLIWFGIDDTLDPARFALLPLPRGRLLAGLFAAALLSVPALATLAATTGLLVPAAAHGGVGAALGQLLGIGCGLLVCVAASRAVTSAFATMLRSRRVRDLAGILLASLAALLAPLQIMIVSAAQRADWEQVMAVARVVGWTPLAAPYTVGAELTAGRPLAALGKLLIGLATLAALLWWWSRTLESAMVGAAHSGGPGRATRPVRGGAVTQLLPRWLPGLPATAFGAMVAREARYWWRDAKRRANVITIAVVGMLVPVLVAGSGRLHIVRDGEEVAMGAASPVVDYLGMLLVAAFTAAVLANQFGFDGTAYATQLTTAVPGRLELRARMVGHAVLMVPLLLVIGVVMAALRGEAAVAPAVWGVLLAGYGAGLAVNSWVSVLVPYALPEGSNPFATATGAGMSKSLLALVAMVPAGVATLPLLLLAGMLGEVWPWVSVPVGAGYGVALAALGCYIAGDLLERRGPELLVAVTPRG